MDELAQLQAEKEVFEAQKVLGTKQYNASQIRIDNQIAQKQAQIDILSN